MLEPCMDFSCLNYFGRKVNINAVTPYTDAFIYYSLVIHMYKNSLIIISASAWTGC